jgi:hypothetical protein
MRPFAASAIAAGVSGRFVRKTDISGVNSLKLSYEYWQMSGFEPIRDIRHPIPML